MHPTLAELRIPEGQVYDADNLIDLYFCMKLDGILGIIRGVPIQNVFSGRQDTVLNLNNHPSPRARIGQIIRPKENEQLFTPVLKNKVVLRLPDR